MKKALYMLAEFSDRDFDWLLSAGRKKSIAAGTPLIREGEITDALYLILEGTLVVSAGAFAGQEIARLNKGEIVGEMSFVDSRLPSATVSALEDVLVWSIPRSQLATKLIQDVEFACHFYHAIAVFLSDRLRDTVSRLGYVKEEPQTNADDQVNEISPQVVRNLELAQARLSWLLNRLKDTP